MIKTIEQLENMVREKYPISHNTADTSDEWKQNRRLLNELWYFKYMIIDDI